MAIIADYDLSISQDGFYNEQQMRLKNTPKIYEFVYMANSEQYKMTLAAASEEDAERLFYELVGPTKVVMENRSANGVLDFVSPGILKYYEQKLGKDLIENYKAYAAEKKAKVAREKALDNLKKKTAKEKQKEQERKHSENVLTQVLDYIKRVGAFKLEKEVIQEKDFKEWMDKKDKQ